MMRAVIVGGDKRSAVAATELLQLGYAVTVCHLSYAVEGADDCGSACFCPPGELLLLPVPVTRDKKTVNGTDGRLSLDSITEIFGRFPLLCGGGLPDSLLCAARKAGCEAVDLLCDEEFVLENAVLTAEATLGLVLCEAKRSPRETDALIVGFGRIGQRLLSLFRSVEMRVSVCARGKEAQRNALLSGALTSFSPDALGTLSARFSLIVNTVPAVLFSVETLRSLSLDTLFVELASGNNLPSGAKTNARLLFAPGLPGKLLPLSAGRLVAHSADRIALNYKSK